MTSSQLSNGTLSILGMAADADAVVKGVLTLLLVASLLTWTVFFAKLIELGRARAQLRRDLRLLGAATSFTGVGDLRSEAACLLTDGVRAEVARAGDLGVHACAEGLKERVTVILPAIESEIARHVSRGLSIIASVGATAPFVGLFGTVWGIMDSFVNISRTQSTSLAVVAPGIAEALLTTAMGLAAAVPAVLIYNGFTRSLSGYRALLADASNATACLLSLQVQNIQVAALPDGKARAPRRPSSGI